MMSWWTLVPLCISIRLAQLNNASPDRSAIGFFVALKILCCVDSLDIHDIVRTDEP